MLTDIPCGAREDILAHSPCTLPWQHTGHHSNGEHRWSIRINGARHCYDCGVEDYDSQWGAGLFTDWPRGTSKPYGA